MGASLAKPRQKVRHDVTDERRQEIKRSEHWYHAQVHQATGVIIAQTNVSPDEALSLLVGHAESTGLGVDAVAAGVIVGKITLT